MHVTVQLKLEKLPQKEEKICELSEKFGVKFSELTGSDGSNDEKIYEVSSKKRLGLTEFETVNEFAEGVFAILDAENSS